MRRSVIQIFLKVEHVPIGGTLLLLASLETSSEAFNKFLRENIFQSLNSPMCVNGIENVVIFVHSKHSWTYVVMKNKMNMVKKTSRCVSCCSCVTQVFQEIGCFEKKYQIHLFIFFYLEHLCSLLALDPIWVFPLSDLC